MFKAVAGDVVTQGTSSTPDENGQAAQYAKMSHYFSESVKQAQRKPIELEADSHKPGNNDGKMNGDEFYLLSGSKQILYLSLAPTPLEKPTDASVPPGHEGNNWS